MSEERATLLVVDDVPGNIQVLNEILQADHQILFATSGKKALELACSRVPDLVLLDVRMPEMDGYAVCRALKGDELTQNIPIIFVTSLDDADDEALGFELGGVDYITKPVNPVTVRARVRTHLQLKRQADMLRRLSNLDGLTGIPNRRCFDDTLAAAWRRCARNRSPMSLILVDIDYFKRYNDHYGHQQGDECLRGVARILSAHMKRIDDLAARYGGEEFVCLLPYTDASGALTLAQSLIESVRAAAVPHERSEASSIVTLSAGLASCLVDRELSPERLIAAADEALYRAKHEGRNRVEVATALLELADS